MCFNRVITQCVPKARNMEIGAPVSCSVIIAIIPLCSSLPFRVRPYCKLDRLYSKPFRHLIYLNCRIDALGGIRCPKNNAIRFRCTCNTCYYKCLLFARLISFLVRRRKVKRICSCTIRECSHTKIHIIHAIAFGIHLVSLFPIHSCRIIPYLRRYRCNARRIHNIAYLYCKSALYFRFRRAKRYVSYFRAFAISAQSPRSLSGNPAVPLIICCYNSKNIFSWFSSITYIKVKIY